MNIEIEWHGDQFNVNLSSKEGAEAFLSVKGCRIKSGSKGEFLSYPATKNERSGKWWSHVWGSEKFNTAVLEKAHATMPRKSSKRDDPDDDLPPF